MQQYPGRIYITNIHFDITEDELYDFLEDYGFSAEYVRIPHDKNYETRYKNRGFAFVDFGTAEEAEAAMEAFSNKPGPRGRPLILKPALPRDPNFYTKKDNYGF
jgi:RNA recognition motif-containing protein